MEIRHLLRICFKKSARHMLRICLGKHEATDAGCTIFCTYIVPAFGCIKAYLHIYYPGAGKPGLPSRLPQVFAYWDYKKIIKLPLIHAGSQNWPKKIVSIYNIREDEINNCKKTYICSVLEKRSTCTYTKCIISTPICTEYLQTGR